MFTLTNAVARALGRDDRGVTSLEYAVMAFGLVAVVYAGAQVLGTDVKTAFTTIGTWLDGLTM